MVVIDGATTRRVVRLTHDRKVVAEESPISQIPAPAPSVPVERQPLAERWGMPRPPEWRRKREMRRFRPATLETLPVGLQDIALAVFEETCQVYGLTADVLVGKTRKPLEVEARRVLIALLREFGIEGVTMLGRLVGKDHSTVLHHTGAAADHPTNEEREMAQDLRRTLTARRRLRPHPALLVLPPPEGQEPSYAHG